jgi:hypothetical protein
MRAPVGDPERSWLEVDEIVANHKPQPGFGSIVDEIRIQNGKHSYSANIQLAFIQRVCPLQ